MFSIDWNPNLTFGLPAMDYAHIKEPAGYV